MKTEAFKTQTLRTRAFTVIPNKLALAVGLAVAATLAGCSGGDSGSSNNTPPNVGITNPGAPGTSAVILAAGEVDGFGSVIVNGVHYDTDNAIISIDGEPATEQELAVGMVVRVEASSTSEGYSAATVQSFSAIGGKIESIDSENKTLVVLGKTVRVDADTQLGEGIDEATLAPLTAGTHIRVSGHPTEDGIVATHLDLVDIAMPGDSVAPVERANLGRLTGVITKLDENTSTFTLEDTVIDYTAARVNGEITSDSRVFVFGKVVEDVLVADKVIVVPTMQMPSIDKVHVTGELTLHEENGETWLEINGVRIDIDPAILEFDRDFEELKGKIAAIRGQIDAAGHIDADAITIEMLSTARAVGAVEDIEAAPEGSNDKIGTLTLSGKTFVIKTDTNFIDRARGEHYFSFADIALGERVIVDGYKDDAGALVAKTIRRIDSAAMPRLARLDTHIAAVDEDSLTTTDGDVVILNEDTRVAGVTDLLEITLGEDGENVVIIGRYDDDKNIVANVIFVKQGAPSRTEPPKVDVEPLPIDTLIEQKLMQLAELINTDQMAVESFLRSVNKHIDHLLADVQFHDDIELNLEEIIVALESATTSVKETYGDSENHAMLIESLGKLISALKSHAMPAEA